MANHQHYSVDFDLDNDEGDMAEADTLLATTSTRFALSPALPHLPIRPPPPPFRAMLNPSAGTYHPDFMFCGACTTCHEPDKSLQPEESQNLDEYEEDDDINANVVVLKTTFSLRFPVTNPSHMLVIQSLVKQLPGVNNVIIHTNDSEVAVYHDASLSAERVLIALKSVGHLAFIQATHANPVAGRFSDEVHTPDSLHQKRKEPWWVRSRFYVRGICCASEVPAIKSIVKSLVGVSTLQINITTKVVHVQHDASVVTAQQIARLLSKEGFPSVVERDGNALAMAKQQNMQQGRSTLWVNGTFTDADVAKVRRSLNLISGVSQIEVNISESLIYVDHNVYTVTCEQLVQALQPEFSCEVHTPAEMTADGAIGFALDHIDKSKYVESTVKLNGLDSAQVRTVEKAIAENFFRAQVRAIYANPISETIKVEHDPKQISIFDVCKILATYGLTNAEVSVDGADAGLFLPQQDNSSGNRTPHGDEASLLKIHANVWLSGIFWGMSMASYLEGK